MKIPEDFRDLLRFLNYQNVEYLIVGGYALAFHGVPRFTGDLDLLTEITGVSWKQAWQNRDTAEIDGIQLNFLSRNDLILNKKSVSRPVDLGDLERLLKI